jgi:energy-coupling factor transporter ATP-binding protein EcfA2
MQIRSLRLQNFKRFTDLRLEGIPENTKLVLLVGANGSGKSSVFDAFELAAYYTRGGRIGWQEPQRLTYYTKTRGPEIVTLDFDDASVEIRSGALSLRGSQGQRDEQWARKRLARLYGRSTLRVASRIRTVTAGAGGLNSLIEMDGDGPRTFIDEDLRFLADAKKYAVDFNHALRQPVFEGRQVDIGLLSEQLIQPINEALHRVFGIVGPSPQMTNFREPEDGAGAVQYFFRKGEHEFPYDVLSFGEKQVFAVLLNLFVRRDKLRDAVIYIDELDLHLNTALQFALLEEIVDRWIPDGNQLWTASHSLGFLRYASQSSRATIFDFDAVDFDLPQMLLPAPKNASEVLQVAVPTEYLPQLFAGRRLIYCEGKDAAKFNSIGLRDTVFADGGNKFAVFGRARDGAMPGIIDRDYLTDAEIAHWQQRIPSLRILGLYSLENYLYHPDNLTEYHGAGFDRTGYIAALLRAKQDAYDELILGILKARDGYPFARDLTKDAKAAWADAAREVQRQLKSNEFASFYPHLPMKDYATHLPERQNLAPSRLARTKWFADRMRELLAGIPLLPPA